MFQRSPWLIGLTLGCLSLSLVACQSPTVQQPPNPAEKKEAAATEEANRIQRTTDQVQGTVQQSEQRVQDAEQQANPKE